MVFVHSGSGAKGPRIVVVHCFAGRRGKALLLEIGASRASWFRASQQMSLAAVPKRGKRVRETIDLWLR